uniref:Ig-like domain-containing protein n=1 Tax=Paramormyrops kingsleyae TaxID=1676925 RepID=A0A3B3QRL6_9TELE
CSGPPELLMDKQEVTGVEGDSVSVQCRYGDSSSEMKWCKIGGSCVSGNSGSLDGRPVEIRDDRINKVFSVTMWGLERKDTGWYRCDDGYQQIPFVTVQLSNKDIAFSHFLNYNILEMASHPMLLLTVFWINIWKMDGWMDGWIEGWMDGFYNIIQHGMYSS